MLFKFDKRFESLAHILMRPKRDYRLQSDWIEGEGTNPCRLYGPGYLVQRRLGDVCPFLDRSLREKFVHVRQETPWAESLAENERLALITAQQNDETEEAIEHLQLWLENIQTLENNEGFRNRIFPRIWRADRGYTTLHLAEQSVKQNHQMLGQDWEYANWNSVNFWTLPYLEDLDLNPDLDFPDTIVGPPANVSGSGTAFVGPPANVSGPGEEIAFPEPESPDDVPPLTTLINKVRSRAILWLNQTTFHGTISATPDLYGTPNGSFTLEFWLNARSSPFSVRPSVLLNIPGIVNFVLLPQRNLNPARPSDEFAGDEKFHLAVVSDAAVQSFSATEPTNPDRVDVFFKNTPGLSTNWNANGWFSSDPLIQRGKWHHCSVVVNTNTAQTLIYIDGRVAHARISDSSLTPNIWWVKDVAAPEYLSLGARPFVDLSPFNPITSPIDGEWVFNPGQDLDLEPKIVYGDPVDAEMHSIRIWNRPLSRTQLLERQAGLLENDPIERNLIFQAQFNFRPDSPPRPRIGLIDFYSVFEEDTPLNRIVAWERGDVVLNLDGFLCDDVNENWGLGVGSFSERIIFPELGQDGAGVESSDVYYAFCGIRNLAILPNDNPNIKPNKRTTKEYWQNLENVEWLRTKHESVMLNANTFINPSIAFAESETATTVDANGNVGQTFALRTPPFQILNRLRVRRTRASTFLEIQSLFYGSRVVPETFEWRCNFALEWLLRVLTSRAPIEIYQDGPLLTSIPFDPNPALATPYVRALRDNPFVQRCILTVKCLEDGTLIRSNPQFPHLESEGELGEKGKSWKVGSLDYAHGMAVVHHPALWRMGELTTKIGFEGERGLWVKEFVLPVPEGQMVSNNPVWGEFYANFESLPQNNTLPLKGNENTVGITDVVLYDRNLNAVLKAKMAQPIYRVPTDKLAFKVKLDF